MKNENQISRQGLTVWIICASFFLYEFFLRTIIGTFQHPIMYDLKLSTFKFSLLSSTCYQVIYALMQIPAGIIVSYYGLKRTVFLAAIICSISAFGFATSTDFQIAVFFRVLAGLGSSFGFVCLLVCVFEWLPHNRSAFYIGLSQFIGTMGAMLAAGPINSIAEGSNLNWRTIFILIGFIGLLLSIVIYLLVENNTNRIGKYQVLNKPEKILTSVKKLFSKASLFSLRYFLLHHISS